MAEAILQAAASASLSTDQKHEMEVYAEVVRFHDTIRAGAHPTVKPPAHLAAPKWSASGAATSTTSRRAANVGMHNKQSFEANTRLSAPTVTAVLPGLGSLPAAPPSTATVFGLAKTEINPILLEKSDELVKAELQLQRQRVERALREQLEQKRASNKIVLPSEQLPDFDLVNVLELALIRVRDDTAALPTDANTAANHSDASDSFDDNTFYSSTFDTPDSHHVARMRTESSDVEMREDSPYEPQLDDMGAGPQTANAQPAPAQIAAPQPAVGLAYVASQQQQQSYPPNVSTRSYPQPASALYPNTSKQTLLHREHGRPGMVAPADTQMEDSQEESGEASRSGSSGDADNEQVTDGERMQRDDEQQQALDEAYEPAISPPVIRAHNLEPFAPQPSHVSPLATSRQAPPVAQPRPFDGPLMALGTPAQVAALRNEPSTASSPEDSPHGNKTAATKAKKKKEKKNKRKRGRPAEDTMPYIKPEPRSPSPMNAPPFSAPQKRQRQGARQQHQGGGGGGGGVLDGELRYEQPRVMDSYQEQYPVRVIREERVPVSYDRPPGDYPPRQSARPVVRYEREHYDDGRIAPEALVIRHVPSPVPYPASYAPEVRTVRSVSHHAVVERPYREPAAHYVDVDGRAVSRLSVRPGADRGRSRSPVMRDAGRTPVMAPPARTTARRIIVDEFGREYIEPPRPAPPPAAAIRQSVAPLSRLGEPEVIYEQPPPIRAPSRMTGASEQFEENGVIYTRASPIYAAVPRRVVTQPEYAAPHYRSYRQREEYSARPAPPPGDEYVQYRVPAAAAAPDRRLPDEPPQEYMTRAAATGVRPAEPVRYEPARDYASHNRLRSVHPEAARVVHDWAPPPPSGEMMRSDHAMSVHPDARHELAPPPPQVMTRGYSVMPVGAKPLLPEGGRVIRREYSVLPPDQPYYERRPPPPGHGDVAYMERPAQEVVYADDLRPPPHPYR